MQKCFAETLPASCPKQPPAKDEALTKVFRLVKNNPATEGCFDSHAKCGRIRPQDVDDECGWAACSLHTGWEPLVKIKRLKKRHPYVVQLDIPKGVGLHAANDKGHINFWRYAETSMPSYVVKIWKH